MITKLFLEMNDEELYEFYLEQDKKDDEEEYYYEEDADII